MLNCHSNAGKDKWKNKQTEVPSSFPPAFLSALLKMQPRVTPLIKITFEFFGEALEGVT